MRLTEKQISSLPPRALHLTRAYLDTQSLVNFAKVLPHFHHHISESRLSAVFVPHWQHSFISLVAWRQHVVWFVAACCAALAANLFQFLDDKSVDIKTDLKAISKYIQPFFLVVAMPLICQLRDRVFPGTGGTGIPQVIAALRIPHGPKRRHQVLSWEILIGKIILLTMGLFAGMTIGREGPSVQVAACFLYLSDSWGKFQMSLVDRGLILAGAAAGITGAFNTPIAGVIFAVEEIGRSFEKDCQSTIVRTAVVAAVISWQFYGNYNFYNGEVRARTDIASELFAIVPIGIVLGLLGGLFSQSLLVATKSYKRLYPKYPILTAFALGLLLAGLALATDGTSLGSGMGKCEEVLKNEETVPIYTSFAIAAGNWICLLSGIPGGLFDPALSTGASLGQMLANSSLNWTTFGDYEAVVLLSMVAYFSGVAQAPLTGAVIVIEMTNAQYLTTQLFLVSICAYECSKLVCPIGLYDGLADMI